MSVNEDGLVDRPEPALIGDNLNARSTEIGRAIGRMNSALILENDQEIQSLVIKALQDSFSLIEVARDADTAQTLRQRCHFDLVIADISLLGEAGQQWASQGGNDERPTAVIYTAEHADTQSVIRALRAGASDFLTKPFSNPQMATALERCVTKISAQRENVISRRPINKHPDKTGMIGTCDLIRSVCDVIKRVAPMPSTVLIEGESGVGKELAASAIHAWSGRSGSFVPINCGGMSAELLESELFGHMKGAFTGAHQGRDGLFTYAQGGTLFLDEIGEMPMSMQTHLLRVLEERTIRPVGGNREIPVDVRVVAATNKDLEQMVVDGRFREDLFYRLNVLSIRMPALRERREDIPELAQHFATSLAEGMGLPPLVINEFEMVRLKDYDWPGNVRELKNLIERSLLLNVSPSQCLGKEASVEQRQGVMNLDSEEDILMASVEKNHILRVLKMEGGNKSAAARRLGVSRKTLERKTQAWGLYG